MIFVNYVGSLSKHQKEQTCPSQGNLPGFPSLPPYPGLPGFPGDPCWPWLPLSPFNPIGPRWPFCPGGPTGPLCPFEPGGPMNKIYFLILNSLFSNLVGGGRGCSLLQMTVVQFKEVLFNQL